MTKRQILLLTLMLTTVTITSACGMPEQVATKRPTRTPMATETPASTPTIITTPNPCAPENIQVEVEKVHKIMREFDDAYNLASVTPREILNPTITEMQRIRRDSEDQHVPSCLIKLKQYQLTYMNTAINTTLYILSMNDTEESRNILIQGIALVRQQHDQYVSELANLLGLTVVAAPTAAPTLGTPEAGATAPTASPPVIINAGPSAVNLREMPDLNSESLGILNVGASAVVLGRTADQVWYQVEFPGQAGQTAWVYASLVYLSDPSVELPTVSP